MVDIQVSIPIDIFYEIALNLDGMDLLSFIHSSRNTKNGFGDNPGGNNFWKRWLSRKYTNNIINSNISDLAKLIAESNNYAFSDAFAGKYFWPEWIFRKYGKQDIKMNNVLEVFDEKKFHDLTIPFCKIYKQIRVYNNRLFVLTYDGIMYIIPSNNFDKSAVRRDGGKHMKSRYFKIHYMPTEHVSPNIFPFASKLFDQNDREVHGFEIKSKNPNDMLISFELFNNIDKYPNIMSNLYFRTKNGGILVLDYEHTRLITSKFDKDNQLTVIERAGKLLYFRFTNIDVINVNISNEIIFVDKNAIYRTNFRKMKLDIVAPPFYEKIANLQTGHDPNMMEFVNSDIFYYHNMIYLVEVGNIEVIKFHENILYGKMISDTNILQLVDDRYKNYEFVVSCCDNSNKFIKPTDEFIVDSAHHDPIVMFIDKQLVMVSTKIGNFFTKIGHTNKIPNVIKVEYEKVSGHLYNTNYIFNFIRK